MCWRNQDQWPLEGYHPTPGHLLGLVPLPVCKIYPFPLDPGSSCYVDLLLDPFSTGISSPEVAVEELDPWPYNIWDEHLTAQEEELAEPPALPWQQD